MLPDEPEARDGLEDLPAEALAFIQQALDQGNAVLQVLKPPPDVTASTYVMLQRPCTLAGADEPGGRTWSFGSLAPGLPALIVLGADEWTSDPSPAPTPSPTHKLRGQPEAPALQRFKQSLAISYDDWREGKGYDLQAIDEATPAQRHQMLELLIDGGLNDWRDIQATHHIGGRAARRALRTLWRQGSSAQRMALLRHAPGFVGDTGRARALAAALQDSVIFGGLSECLDEIEHCHPPEVIGALWQALQRPETEVAVHCAAMLAWLHGLADLPFDWQHRPFFLRCGSDDPAERQAAQAELRQRCTIAPSNKLREEDDAGRALPRE